MKAQRVKVKPIDSKDRLLEDITEVATTELNGEEKSPTKKDLKKQDNMGKGAYRETEFEDLAKLLGKTIKEVKDECLYSQIKKIMAKTSKVVVRYAPDKMELANILHNCSVLGINGILCSPPYVAQIDKITKKQPELSQKTSVIVDFPFGEASFSGKVSQVKEMARKGVNDITVMMPSLLLNIQDIKAFRKQVAKFSKIKKGGVGIALSATDLTEEQIRLALKAIEKISLGFVTFIFGEVTFNDAYSVLSFVKDCDSNKPIRIMANIKDEDAILRLCDMGVEQVLTPYADVTGKNLVKRFKVDGLTLK